MMAVLAAHAQKAIFQATTLEVVVEFSSLIPGYSAALLLHQKQELRVILIDNLVKKRLLGAMALISARALVRGNPCRTHTAILCILWLTTACGSLRSKNSGGLPILDEFLPRPDTLELQGTPAT
jgi:hypothetical protein